MPDDSPLKNTAISDSMERIADYKKILAEGYIIRPESKQLSEEKQALIDKYNKQVTFGKQPVEPQTSYLKKLRDNLSRRRFGIHS